MKVGNVYVDIEIEALNKKNFLQYKDLVDLQIIETTGTSLPIIYACFLSTDTSIINYIVQNNKVKVKIGKSEAEADTFLVDIYASKPPSDDTTGITQGVEFAGFLINQDFMTNLETKVYEGNSLFVAKQMIKDYFNTNIVTNIDKTNENQVKWMRTNKTAFTFLAETLVHMDIMPSFPLFAFDKFGKFHLKDFNKAMAAGPVAYFVNRQPDKTNEIQYFNTFTTKSYKDSYNLYSGFNKVTEIIKSDKGVPNYTKSYNEPVIAATKESEQVKGSSRSLLNIIQSGNVHNTYVEAFTYNTNKLVGMSAIAGTLILLNDYYRNLKPADIVSVSTSGESTILSGLYVIDTIRTKIDMNKGLIATFVYVKRDNKNNVENYVANPKKGIKIKKKFFSQLLDSVSRLRVAYASAKRIMDGSFMKDVLAYAIATKVNLLRSFQVGGSILDFNSSASLMQSLLNMGNNLMNNLLSMIFPPSIAGIFRDFMFRKPNLKNLLFSYINIYVPWEIRDIITSLTRSLVDTTSTLNSIAKDNKVPVYKATFENKKAVSGSSSSDYDYGDVDSSLSREDDYEGHMEEGMITNDTDTSEIDYTANNQQKINDVIKDFENNTTGLNIPFPVLTLNETQSLYTPKDLRDYLADQTIKNLEDLDYLEGVDKDKFKEILLGEEKIDFNIINQINENTGSSMSFRLWGTYSDLIELTSFYIKKSFKDKYRNIPCTKLINATDNIKLFFCCPAKEEDLRFYINSNRVEVTEDVDVFNESNKLMILKTPITLDYTDMYGVPLPYSLYCTNKGFNSTSVLFEVKQGMM